MNAKDIIRAFALGLIALWVGIECGDRIGERRGEIKGYKAAWNHYCWIYANCPGGLTCHNDGTRGSVQIKKPMMVYHN